MSTPVRAGRRSPAKVNYVASSDEEEDVVRAPVAGPSKKRKAVIADSESDFENIVEAESGSEGSGSKDSGAESDFESVEGKRSSSALSEVAGSENEESDEEVVVAKAKPKARAPRESTTGAPPRSTELDESLPPLFKIDEIFADLVSKARSELVKVAQKLKGRKIRVATMCSGTESPLLALEQISRALETLSGEKLQVEHIFSCEIVPIKQAYIERNFSPPLLFRNVEELGGDQAHTAYAGLADVPGNVDVLVAGTSCVDYSGLNNQKKGLDGGGESGKTFEGMMRYVVKHQPPIVILENVSGAPWVQVVKKFAENGYWAQSLQLDTKNYYIPHTRVRGYLIAVPKASGKQLPNEWVAQVKKLRRPASSPLEAFLLPTDDPRIHRAREELSKVVTNADGAQRAPVGWVKCEGRHARARVEEDLGKKRPLTAWLDGGGGAQLLDGGWTDWVIVQTERVTDLMDISFLRLARELVDVTYKSAIWNLSQNVDRNTDSKKLSLSPCLTPNMIPYLANRGGPIIGLEALALQGLPIEELRLTRENNAQIADLAGNAMTSTVVGAALISALIIAVDTFPDRAAEDVEMEGAVVNQTAADHIRGEDRLSTSPLDLVTCKPLSPSLFNLASATVRKCVCEGRSGTTSNKILVCESCLHSSCTACSGRPDHHYKLDDEERRSPDEFAKELKETLPMRFSLNGFDLAKSQQTVEALRVGGLPVNQLPLYLETVAAAVNSNDNEFHFKTLTRRDTWVATYTASRVVLELHFVAQNPEWRLFVLPDPATPGDSPLRAFLGLAVARLKLTSDSATLLSGVWELRVPLVTQEVELTLEPEGVPVPSWRANLGLTQFKDEARAKRLKISCSDSSLLDQSVSGTYVLEEQCGTAANSLFRRIDDDLPGPLFFFFDPSRSGDAEFDSFVFSSDCGRLDYGISRPIVATLNCKWRPSESTEPENVKLSVTSKWVALTATDVNSSETSIAGSSTFSVPSENFSLNFDADACSFAEAILSAHVVTSDSVRNGISTSKEWEPVDLLHQGSDIFSKLAWILARFPEMKALENWQTIKNTSGTGICQICCPTPPEIEWSRTVGKGFLPEENGIDAAAFEKALKARPTPIDVQVRQVDDCSEFRIGLNIATLAHKALDALPKSVVHAYSVSSPTSSWRLVAANGFSLAFGRSGLDTTKFRLTSNLTNEEAPAPPRFKVELRKEQRRSLTWMIEQETSPMPWVEEEVCEAALPQLGWHAEAKASRVVQVRGGVLADDVGYGKTAIIVGLICSQQKSIVLPTTPDRVAVKATLVVVPPHLVKQWPTEISKFAKGLKVVTIVTVADLKKLSIEDIQNADVIVTTSRLFTSEALWAQTGDFAAGSRSIPCKANARYFNACLAEAVESIPGQITLLRGKRGSVAAYKRIKQVRLDRIAAAAADLEKVKASKRLVGAAYANDQAKKSKAADDEDDEPPAKKAKVVKKKEVVVEVDPWGLTSEDVKNDWNQMMSPPLMMFSFDRIVVDEYTYLDATELSGVLALRASSRWILSGTPPLRNFAEIKTIAALLHVNLGIDDDEEDFLRSGAAKANTLKTPAEQFHSFVEVHTTAWHQRRNDNAQQFLDQFVRQNKAEIGDIEFAEQLEVVELPAAEMAIYRELEHYMLGLDENLKKVVKVAKSKKGDRDVRLAEALGFSKSPDEALLKRCSHFSTDMDDEIAALEGGAPDVCTSILNKREAQLEECQEEYKNKVLVAINAHRIAEKTGLYVDGKTNDRPVLLHLQFISKSVDDADAFAFLENATKGMLNSDRTKIVKFDGDYDKAELKLWRDLSEKTADLTDAKRYAIREMATYLRKLQKELVGRYRSKRYFEAVRHLQINRPADAADTSLLSCCGHQGPTEDVLAAARQSVCIADGCSAAVSLTHVVSATSLGVEATSGQFGIKLEVLVDLVQSVPEDDRILVFVQFEELLDKVQEALVANGIDVAVLQGPATVVSKTLDTFQDPKADGQRVLLLLVTSSSASGANLTIANWAFFVSPLYTDTQEMYNAFELQAIGRIRRFGQLKAVKVVRLLTKDTKDIEIYEQRTQSNVAEIVARQLMDGTNMERLPSSAHEARRKSTKSSSKSTELSTSKSKAKVDVKGKGKAPQEEMIIDDDDEESAEETEEDVKSNKRVAKSPKKKIVEIEDSEDDSEEEVKSKKRAEKGKGKEVVAKKTVAKKGVAKEKVPKEKVSKEKDEKVVKEKVPKEVVKEKKPRASNCSPLEEAELKQKQLLKSQKAAKANLKQSTLFDGFNKKFKTASPKKAKKVEVEVEKENDGDVEMAVEDEVLVTTGNVTEEDRTTVDEDMTLGTVDLESLNDDEKELWA